MKNVSIESPYPGLRPFTPDEAKIFFGRGEQTRQLLHKLPYTRFISVIGLSGCGKSSLVQAGMIASLQNEDVANNGVCWRTVTMRPGNAPIRHLAEALLSDFASGLEHPPISEEFSPDNPDALSSLHDALRRSSLGLVEVLHKTPLPQNTNFLIVVDQFEELFRYHDEGEPDETGAFVELLLRSAAQNEIPIFVMTTMRSEYISECALFYKLPEVMNLGQFFVPYLTREQQQMAIVSPAGVFGGSVESHLVNHLLDAMENEHDQLPLLQHCLMRMCSQKRTKKSKKFTLTMKDYEKVGGLQDALSAHADEAFYELDAQQQMIAERMFRCLSERGTDRRDKRHPLRVKDIAAIAGVSVSELKKVADIFRRPDRCFLTPTIDLNLEPDSVLDISHESLIRHWKTLNTWLDREAESVEIYRRIEHTAYLWKEGKADLWSARDLEIAQEWQQRERPSVEWARRYGNNFALAMEFLEASVRTQRDKQLEEERIRHQEQEIERKRQLREELARQKELKLERERQLQEERFRQKELEFKRERQLEEKQRQRRELMLNTTLWGAVIVAVIAIIGAIWAFNIGLTAHKVRETAEEQRQQAVVAANEAKEAQEKAENANFTYKQMVATMFRFLSESGQNKQFFRWVENTASATETLIPGLHLMIDASDNINTEDKLYWKTELFALTEEKQLGLLNILGGMEASEIIKQEEPEQVFRILHLVVKNENGAIIHPWDGIYFLKPGENVAIEVDVERPSNGDMKIEYTNVVQDSVLSDATGTASGITVKYTASTIAGSRDLVTIRILDNGTGKIMDQKIITVKIIESSLQSTGTITE